jgi:hypothetical protein
VVFLDSFISFFNGPIGLNRRFFKVPLERHGSNLYDAPLELGIFFCALTINMSRLTALETLPPTA